MRKKYPVKALKITLVVFIFVCLFVVLLGIPSLYKKAPIKAPLKQNTSTPHQTEQSKEETLPKKTTIPEAPINDPLQNTLNPVTESPDHSDPPPTSPPVIDTTPEITITSTPTPSLTPEPTYTIIPDPTATCTPPNTNIDINTENEDYFIKIYISEQSTYVELPLEEYITGVVLAEMSYLSETEALRAQAVAARTFCLNRSTNTPDTHPLSAVCNRSSHCMGYYSKEYIISKYGEDKGYEIWKKVNDIVISTKGEYLTYNGKIISAMFHDSSYGTTESTENLYGYPKDYLVCVKTPEALTEYTQSFTIAKVIKCLFDSTEELNDIGNPIGEIVKFENSGRVSTIEIYGKKFTGLQIFISLGLRSMDFDVTSDGNQFVFVCRGFGHGIGMSQKGANLYASMGLDYREILLHYYKGCEI